MSNEQKIIDKIISDAREEAEKILSSARMEADRWVQEAEDKSNKEKAQLRKLSEAEAQKEADRGISAAQMEAKKRILQTKQEVLEEVLREAKETLFSLSDKEYEKTIFSMLSKANIGAEDEIILSSEDKKKFGDAVVNAGYRLSDEARELSKGFIVKNGDIEYNYSFESIMTVERDQLEMAATQILFR